MCNKEIDHQKLHNQSACLMDSHSTTPPSAASSAPGSNDDIPRVKFLCSFLGSILPRPQDGKLRYVGGETRIVSLPRDISYEDLMNRMRELCEGAAVLKYQQPDEDLDALVSVVNDDDVTNMMEEYDKLGSGDGFMRLRIFLFSHPDLDGSSHYVDGDERETERRYVDALNNLNDSPDFRKLQHLDSLCVNHLDDIHVAEHFFNTMSIEGGLHSQRSSEIPMTQYNLHHLAIPPMGLGQHQQPVAQRYTEMDGSWSPAYYSPRHHGHHDPRSMGEFPSSPSSARYHIQFGELPDKGLDRMPEEYARQQANHHQTYDLQPQTPENVVWMPAGAISGEKGGFPGNVLHGPGILEGTAVCEHCWLAFHRNQPHLEQPSMGNGPPLAPSPCAECPPNRESFMLNRDTKFQHGIYPKDQSDPRSIYNDTYGHERGWILQHQLNPRVEEARTQISSTGRLNDHYIVDGPGMNCSLGHGNLVDGHHMSSIVHHRAGPELTSDGFQDQALATPSHLHIPSAEERGARYGNYPCAVGADNLYPVSHGHLHPQTLWRNIPNNVPGAPSHEASSLPPQMNGSVNPNFFRGPVESGARFCIGVDNQNPWVDSSQKVLGFDGTSAPEPSYAHSLKKTPKCHSQENLHHFTPDQNKSSAEMLNCATHVDSLQRLDPSSSFVHNKLHPESGNNSHVAEAAGLKENTLLGEDNCTNHIETVENSDVPGSSCPEKSEVASHKSDSSNCLGPSEKHDDVVKPGEIDPLSPLEDAKLSVQNLTFLPELIASAKEAALKGVDEVRAHVEENAGSVRHDSLSKEATITKSDPLNGQGELELDSDNEHSNICKIEPTKAEAEAIDRGLQTIKNDDLEEIRELGSGTYGAVYHGKWKGSDVAIKRIKASCFAGRPSERERLIADFWKEALILSSLHHPNVVSFYGIVRDGPDGSLATVTEFMVNGSLKQFLQKKDRTIDRRKRLIIAMDAAFGMEYLHGKNIVHFDLKCENLLVNMRDPQRPVCKIGDLGLSKVKQQTLVSGGVRGTLPWMAPELLSGKSNMVTEKIDVYSFGIVMWELLTGEEPYADMHCASIIGGIVNNSLRPKIPTWCDPEWKSLMESCWASDPVERPSFSEISQKLRNMAAAINVK